MNSLLRRLRKLADEELETLSEAVDREIRQRLGGTSPSPDQNADATVLSYSHNKKLSASWAGKPSMRKRRKFRRAA